MVMNSALRSCRAGGSIAEGSGSTRALARAVRGLGMTAQGTLRGRFFAQLAMSAIALLLLPALAAAQETARPEVEYRLGPKDLVEIKVFEVPELNIERRVNADGTITLPLIGDVDVVGLTDDEMANRLKAILEAQYVQRASVSVQIREFRSRPISVLGAVKQPGPLAFSGRWTLLEALAAAGGLSDQVGDKIYILRRADNGLSDQIVISVDDLMVRADPDANIPIFANDMINVPARVVLTVFCLGEVKSPGALQFNSSERMTLLTAVARAGGLTDRASKKLRIKRRDRNGKEVEIEVDYRRVLSGKEADVVLESGDVLVVKESFL
jgi:polysaccharide biosynthesis/export protein